MRVLEIGCGPGAMAREIARRIPGGHVLAIDRSARAIHQVRAGSKGEIQAGLLSCRCVAVEDFELLPDETLFDLAVAIRVGAFDGRFPELGKRAFGRIRKALKKKGRLFIDGGNPLRIYPSEEGQEKPRIPRARAQKKASDPESL